MKTFCALFLILICSAQAAMAQNKRVLRTKTLLFELGTGTMDFREKWFYTGNQTLNLNSFHSPSNFQTAIGYGFKLDILQIEWKIGFSHAAYDIDLNYYGGGKGISPGTEIFGSTTINQAYAQLIGLNLGKERSWGSFILGGFVRYNFLYDENSKGKNITSGNYWDGTTVIPVYRENKYNSIIKRQSLFLGAQGGMNLRLNSNSQIQIKAEAHFLKSTINDHIVMAYFLNIGYVFTLKSGYVQSLK